MTRSRGGRSSLVFDRYRLLRRVEACKLSNQRDVDEIVERLRSSFPDYKRYPIQPFKKHVQITLENNQRRELQANYFEDGDNNPAIATPSTSPHRKKFKKSDEREARLLQTENEYLSVRRKQQNPSSSSSSTSSSSSDEEEENGAVSTSEDAIFGEKVEPEFDLMKSMLRSSYSASKNVGSKVEEEKNLEVEVVNKRTKIDLVNGDGEGIEGKRKLRGLSSKGERDLKSGDGCEVKGKDGPRFKDLGGMQGVLNELIMEVIFPLYHPQVPRWLGVKPMAGILLHGPPGCGKTKLAHAIANETGVPFYKISATEVVSGVSGV